MPDGRIAADPSRQDPNSSCYPISHYEDYEYNCRDCRRPQVWTAEDQKWWYEVARGSLYAKAARCPECRAVLRAAHRGTPRRSHADRMSELDGPRVAK